MNTLRATPDTPEDLAAMLAELGELAKTDPEAAADLATIEELLADVLRRAGIRS